MLNNKAIVITGASQGLGEVLVYKVGFEDIQAGNNSLWQTYGVTKWAMIGFTKALKDALKDTRIKISGFFPSGFSSNL